MLNQTLKKIKELLKSNNIKSKIFGREKKPYSIWKKMKVKSVNFSQLSNIMGLQFTRYFRYCYKGSWSTSQKYSYVPGRFKDYISTPKPNGYQSLLTTLIGPLNQRIEIQIRSHKMNDLADLGVAAHWIYKNNITNKDGKNFKEISQILEILDQSKKNLKSF